MEQEHSGGLVLVRLLGHVSGAHMAAQTDEMATYLLASCVHMLLNTFSSAIFSLFFCRSYFILSFPISPIEYMRGIGRFLRGVSDLCTAEFFYLQLGFCFLVCGVFFWFNIVKGFVCVNGVMNNLCGMAMEVKQDVDVEENAACIKMTEFTWN